MAIRQRVADAFRGVADWRDSEYLTKLKRRDALVMELADKRDRHATQVDSVTAHEARLRELRTKALLGEASESDVRAAEKVLTKARQDLAAEQDAIVALEDSVALLDARLPGLEDEARRRNVEKTILPQYEALLAEQIAAAKHFADVNTRMHHFIREVISEAYPEDIYAAARYRPVNNYLPPGAPRFLGTAWHEFVLSDEPDSERSPIERWFAAIRRAGHKV